MSLRWQSGVANNTRGCVVQVCDVGSYSYAPLEDPDTPDHVISRDFAEQSSSKAKRAVQFQRFVEGTAHGEPWATTMGGTASEPPAPEDDDEPENEDEDEDDEDDGSGQE